MIWVRGIVLIVAHMSMFMSSEKNSLYFNGVNIYHEVSKLLPHFLDNEVFTMEQIN